MIEIISQLLQYTVRYKILEGENFGKFGELQQNRQNLLSKIFSFEKFVIRKYAVSVCANTWMALLKYYKLKTSGKQALPDLNGELSAKIPSSSISSANACVGKLLDGNGPRDKRDSGLRGPYKILTPAQKFDIGKRAAEIGTTSAMRYYAKNLI